MTDRITIDLDEMNRLLKRDKQVDDYCGCYPSYISTESWYNRFKETAKPKQYRPTLDELVQVYERNITCEPLHLNVSIRRGLRAVIDRVYQGMDEDYVEGDMSYQHVVSKHHKGYQED